MSIKRGKAGVYVLLEGELPARHDRDCFGHPCDVLQSLGVRAWQGNHGLNSINDAACLAGKRLPQDAKAVGPIALELLGEVRACVTGGDAEEPTGQKVKRQAELIALPPVGGGHEHCSYPFSEDIIAKDAPALRTEGQTEEVRNRTKRHVQRPIRHLGNRNVVAIEIDMPLALGHNSYTGCPDQSCVTRPLLVLGWVSTVSLLDTVDCGTRPRCVTRKYTCPSRNPVYNPLPAGILLPISNT